MLKNFSEVPNLFWVTYCNKNNGGMFMFLQNLHFYKKLNLSLDIIKQHAMMTYGGLEE